MKLINRISAIHMSRVKTIILLAISFSLTRLIFRLLGVRYDASSIDSFYQYLDPVILRDRLFPALLNLHSQPPGFNLMLGVVLNICPNSSLPCFQILYLLFGFLLYCSIYYFLRLSNFSRRLSLLGALVFIVSPSSILYENWLYTTYPLAVLLTLAVVALRRFTETPRTLYAASFLFLCACACLTRSAFHLVFLMACVPFVLIPRGVRWRRVALVAVCAICLVTTLYLKNFLMFGFFGNSSWAGMNLFKTASLIVDTNTVANLVQSGSIPSIASVPWFSPLAAYADTITPSLHHFSAPELTAETKLNGWPNFNHEAYISISRNYQSAATYIIRRYPRLYCSVVFDSWLLYCTPSWQYIFVRQNTARLSKYISLLSMFRVRGYVNLQTFKRAVFGVTPPIETRFRGFYLLDLPQATAYPLTSLLFLPTILFAACLRSVVYIYRRARHGNISGSGITFIFMTMTVMYVAIIGNAVEYGENNRFRVMTDPLIFLLVALMCRDVFSHVVRTWRKQNPNNSVILVLQRCSGSKESEQL